MTDEKITMHRVTDEAPGRCASCAASVGRWVDADRVEIKAHLVCSSCLAALAEAQRERDELDAEIETLRQDLADQTKAAFANQAEAQRREELMRPVVEAVGPMIANWRKNGYRPDSHWATPQSHALVAAWDTYETQTGGTE